MRTLVLAAALLAVQMSQAVAQQTSFLSIPSSAFTPRAVTGGLGYDGNKSGTNRHFGNDFWMFAPVALPHGSKVVALRCGGMARSPDFQLVFTLRRNQPQMANVDMATIKTTFEGGGFQHPETNSIASPLIDNNNFNYFIVAEARNVDVAHCGTDCTIGYCRIRYTVD